MSAASAITLNSTLAGEWGLSLHLESQAGGATGQYLLDFGYTPEILVRNFDLLGIEPERLNGLILSHAHRDHYGGLAGFVAHYRMRDDLRLFAGGKEAFREKWVGSRDEEPASWGALDRAALEAAKVETVYCECAHGLDGPFTSGNIARQSFERVLPNTLVEQPQPITSPRPSGAADWSPTATQTSMRRAMLCGDAAWL
jgi:7,8-dihydropterin-6-yl-methyl-4-(beta-D-ribofuranosyl)aminobenzene 5'-phosphate synthase